MDRPLSRTISEFNELTLMLMAGPVPSVIVLPMMMGCAPRTKMVASLLTPRPARSASVVPNVPTALFSKVELVMRASA